MEQPSVGGTQEVLWCNYNADGTTSIATSAHIPLQLDLSNSSIARQLSQQMQVQYALNGQGQIVYQVPQPHTHLQQVVVGTAPQPTASAAGTTIAPIVPQQVIEIPVSHALPEIIPSKPSKPRSGTTNERVQCEMCEKTFSCSANLRDHMRLHTGQKPFKCTECDMEFAQRSNWRLHRRVHTGEKPYMCGICGKTFARSSHLPSHMRIHTGEKPFECELCHNSFPSSQALKNHTRTHTGEKPFTCRFCETSFTHSSSLSSHKKKCNGVKRKRGRPIGTGRKPTKKKQPSGRPRGRPKKKLRTGRGRKRLNPPALENFDGLADVNTQSLMDTESNIPFVKIEGGVNIEIDTEATTEVCDESFETNEIIPNKLVEKSSDSLPVWKENTTKQGICSATDDGESSRVSKHPKVAIRESQRLRIKQENRRANRNAVNSIKIEPESRPYDPKDVQSESIVVDFESSDEPFYPQPLVLEHRVSNIADVSTFPSCDSPCIQIDIASGSAVTTTNMIDHNHQKEVAALTMATLQEQQQQGVLNLTHQADLRNVQVVTAGKNHSQPVISFLNPLDLQQHNPQQVSTHNTSVVTQSIPVAHSSQHSSSVRKMNIKEPSQETVGQLHHPSEVDKEGTIQHQVPEHIPHTQYVSYQLGDSKVHVPVPLNRSLDNYDW